MEQVISSLELSKIKREEFIAFFDMVRSQALSKWKDLEDGLDMTRVSLEDYSKSLTKREYNVVSKEKEIEDRELKLQTALETFEASKQDFQKEIDEMVIEAERVEARALEVDVEFKEKRREIDLLDSLLESKLNKLGEKEKRCNEVELLFVEKETELDRVQGSLLEATEKLDVLKETVQERTLEAESKAKDIDLVKEKLKTFEDVVMLKEKRLLGMQSDFESCCREFELKKDKLIRLEISIEESEHTMKIGEKKLGSIHKKLEQCSHELELKQKNLVFVKNSRETMRKSMDQFSLEFGAKERRIESLLEQIEEAEMKKKLRESELDNISSILKKVDICLEELEANEKKFACLEIPVCELFQELKVKEIQLEMNVGKFESKRKKLESSSLVIESPLKKIKTEPCERAQNALVCHQSCFEPHRLSPTSCNEDSNCEFIQELIQIGEIIHDIGHTLELKLTDKFSPVNLLTKYLEELQNCTDMVCAGNNSPEEKRKAIEKEIAALRATMERLRENSLEPKSSILFEDITKRIGVLEESVGSGGEHLKSFKNKFPNFKFVFTRSSKRQRAIQEMGLKEARDTGSS